VLCPRGECTGSDRKGATERALDDSPVGLPEVDVNDPSPPAWRLNGPGGAPRSQLSHRGAGRAMPRDSPKISLVRFSQAEEVRPHHTIRMMTAHPRRWKCIDGDRSTTEVKRGIDA
jgi:hypothetical protein